MATAVKSRRQSTRRFLERGPLGDSPNRVDREKGIIYGVKVLGLESANGRRYLPEAVRRAAHLYEGASVRSNHPKRSDDQREVEDVFGWLENVRIGDGGELYADLHILNIKTELAESVLNAAEKNPRLFGLSHNAEGTGDTQNGVYVVQEICKVVSVDLVADPATTSGLFEGKKTMSRIKVARFLEDVAARLPRRQRIKLLKLLEYGGVDEVAEMDEPAAEVEQSPEDALKAGFRAAAVAALDAALDGDEEAGKKLMEILKNHKKMSPAKAVEEEDEDQKKTEEDDDKGELEECDDDMKKTEGKKSKALSPFSAMTLFEEAGVSYTSSTLQALCLLPESARQGYLADLKKLQEQKAKTPVEKARTQKPGISETAVTEAVSGPKSWRELSESRNGTKR